MADSNHTVSSYDEELRSLTNMIVRMGGLAESHLATALQALSRRDSDLAGKVIAADQKVDDLETEVQTFTVRMLALRQPVAEDLRVIVGALKTSSDLERIADYAANVAKRVLVLNTQAPLATKPAILRIGKLAQAMINDVLDAYLEQDIEKAIDVWQRDEELDALHTSVFREQITYMMEDPRTLTAAIHMMFIAKNIERIGDHATNVAETIYYSVEGRSLPDARPKADDASLAADYGVQQEPSQP